MKRFIISLLCGVICVLSGAKDSPWKEIQTVILPQSVTIYEGVTRSGNAKYWIEIENIKVSVAPTNVSKFQRGEVKLELVKWQNIETKKFKYSTRQVKSSGSSTRKEEKNIDLTSLF